MAFHVDQCPARLVKQKCKMQVSMQQVEAGYVEYDQDVRNHDGASFLIVDNAVQLSG